jgi:hypothetical protein
MTASLHSFERELTRSIRAHAKAVLVKPRPGVAAVQVQPITVVLSCRAYGGGFTVKRSYPIRALCRHIAINDAQRLARLEGYPDTVVLDWYEGWPHE